jgi:adenine-specific DNA-methyltransferase
VRYIGNKTRLLDFIGEVIRERGLAPSGGARRPPHAVDAFAGTASVGRHLKRMGFRVSSCDIMTYSLVLQKAGVELDSAPSFSALRNSLGIPPQLSDVITPFQSVLTFMEEQLPPVRSLITREFSGDGSRMYFSSANAGRIDAIREAIDSWRADNLIDDAEQWVLLASLIESLDAVANTTGVYAAYVKSWQPNALRPLRLRAPDLTTDTGLQCRAIQGDINSVAPSLGRVDILYLDPPYNSRQYSGYYHIPELVAMGWANGAPELRGKTGLIPDNDKRSAWCRRSDCVNALNDLLDNVDARYVLMSYNSEGIIPDSEIRSAFAARGVPGTFRVHEQDYARYRSDRDSDTRRYKGSRVTERIYFVELKR